MTEAYRIRTISGTVSTDDIIPGKYKHASADPAALAPHVFENYLPGYAATLREGDALWSDSIFGIGSSREQAATSLLAAGVKVVIAPNFGRIFYRNAWNIGLRLIEIDRIQSADLDGEEITVDWDAGTATGSFGRHDFARPPKRLMDIIEAGGLINWILVNRVERPVAPAAE